ncbi:MAG: peptidyl-tRNA hydrolase [Candidatus Aenigmatarchaeota archaeon]|nr:MAG: peptidyl-tRNA hydrolase [Candidatus Aenigmarchaeota archaeon]
MYKQIIVLRTDLKMSRGKMIAQACHASLGAYKKSDQKVRDSWEREGAKKVVLKANKEELFEMMEKAKRLKLPTYLVKDAGLTELPPSTPTALGIGPADEEEIDKITGFLPLLR